MAIDNTRSADITAVAGSTGSGKSAWIMRQLKGRKRIIVFDAKDEYGELPGFRRFTSVGEMARHLLRVKAARVAFVPSSREDLDPFCRVAWAWGDCTVVIEESAAYTNPGKAPPAYHRLLTQGRAIGLRMFVVTQRPAESDKTVWGNQTLIWCGRLARRMDRKTMADELDCPIEQLNALRPLDFVIKRSIDSRISADRVRF